MVVFLQSRSIRAKLMCSGKSGCLRPKVIIFGKMVVFRQNGCIRAKVVVFGKK